MKNVLSVLSQITFLVVVAFIVLFDRDGVQAGIHLFPAIPVFALDVAHILGNVMWLLGVLFFIGAGALLAPLFNEDIALKNYKQLKEKGAERLESMSKIPVFRLVPNIVVSVFAIGSGFWFSGPGMLLVAIGTIAYKTKMKKMWEEDENAPKAEKPTAYNLAKNLLDDE